MVPRAVALALLVTLALPQVHGDPAVPPTGQEDVIDCITIGWWPPPPYVAIGDCDKLAGKLYVNGTDAGYVP